MLSFWPLSTKWGNVHNTSCTRTSRYAIVPVYIFLLFFQIPPPFSLQTSVCLYQSVFCLGVHFLAEQNTKSEISCSYFSYTQGGGKRKRKRAVEVWQEVISPRTKSTNKRKQKMLSVNGDSLAVDHHQGNRSRKTSLFGNSRKLSARMDTEVQEAFKLFDKDQVCTDSIKHCPTCKHSNMN